MSASVCVIIAKLAKFRIQTAARINERMPTMLEGVFVFVAVEAKPPVCSEGISASGGRKEVAPKGRVVCLKRGTNGKIFCIMMLF